MILFEFEIEGCDKKPAILLDPDSDECRVMTVLQYYYDAEKPVTCRTIAAHCGYTREFSETGAIRKVRQYLHNLREKGLPLVSSPKGVSVPRTKDEVIEYCEWVKQKAQSDIRSMMYIRKTILKAVDVQMPLSLDLEDLTS